MQLHPLPVSSVFFNHFPVGKRLIAEVSSLGEGSRFHRLYDDAVDAGLALRNDKTGNITYWYHHKDYRDADGDLCEIALLPTSESVRKNPSIAGYKMVLIND